MTPKLDPNRDRGVRNRGWAAGQLTIIYKRELPSLPSFKSCAEAGGLHGATKFMSTYRSRLHLVPCYSRCATTFFMFSSHHAFHVDWLLLRLPTWRQIDQSRFVTSALMLVDMNNPLNHVAFWKSYVYYWVRVFLFVCEKSTFHAPLRASSIEQKKSDSHLVVDTKVETVDSSIVSSVLLVSFDGNHASDIGPPGRVYCRDRNTLNYPFRLLSPAWSVRLQSRESAFPDDSSAFTQYTVHSFYRANTHSTLEE